LRDAIFFGFCRYVQLSSPAFLKKDTLARLRYILFLKKCPLVQFTEGQMLKNMPLLNLQYPCFFSKTGVQKGFLNLKLTGVTVFL
jgi:hypothetical protein